MAKKNVHTVRHDDGWANRRNGNDRVSSTHKTQQEAIDRYTLQLTSQEFCEG